MNSRSCCALLLIGLGYFGAVHLATLTRESPSPADSGDAQQLDLKTLPARWHANHYTISESNSGKINDCLGTLSQTLVVTREGTIRLELEGVKFFEWTATYDTKNTPAKIDLTLTYPPRDDGKKVTAKGLIELKGDDLILHFSCDSDSDERPTDFEHHKGLSSVLIKCKREK